jgi:hypothetical protein
MCYLIEINELKQLSIQDVVERLQGIEGIKIGELKVNELVFYNNKPIYTGNGVYVFKDTQSNDFIYVGSCVARNFVERIPAHFDIRHEGWFNSLLVNIIKVKYDGNKTNDNLTKAAQYAFSNLSLILINYEEYNRESIKYLESTLRKALKPYNKFKTRFIEDYKAPLFKKFEEDKI